MLIGYIIKTISNMTMELPLDDMELHPTTYWVVRVNEFSTVIIFKNKGIVSMKIFRRLMLQPATPTYLGHDS